MALYQNSKAMYGAIGKSRIENLSSIEPEFKTPLGLALELEKRLLESLKGERNYAQTLDLFKITADWRLEDNFFRIDPFLYEAARKAKTLFTAPIFDK